VGSLALGFLLSRGFGVVALAYAVLLLAYSAWLKHVVIVDVLVVAIGFVLRAVAGALAIGVAISGWLLICTILLALFLALGNRRRLGGNPSELFLSDRALLVNTFLWMLAVLLIIYGPAIAARLGV